MWLTPFTSLRIREDKNCFQSPWIFQSMVTDFQGVELGQVF